MAIHVDPFQSMVITHPKVYLGGEDRPSTEGQSKQSGWFEIIKIISKIVKVYQ